MRRNVRYGDFSGGLNTTDNPFLLQPNELQECTNFVSNRRGKLSLRKGYMVISTVVPTGTEIDGLWRLYDTAGYGVLLGAAYRGLFKVEDGRGQLTDYPYYSTGRNVSGVPFKGRLYVFSNGKMSVWYSDGFQVFQGYDAPGPEYLVQGYSQGYPNGGGTNQLDLAVHGCRWYIAFYDHNGEGTASVFDEIGTLVGYDSYLEHVELRGIDTHGNTGYIGRKIYRSALYGSIYQNSPPEGTPRLVAVIENMTDTTYEDNSPDSLLGEEMPRMVPPGVAEAPGSGEGCACEFQNRIFHVWGRASSEIRWTREFEPYSWPASNAYTIAPTGGQRITALVPLSGRLLAFTPSRIYALYGDFSESDPNYGCSLISSEVGCDAPHSIAADGDVLYFYSQGRVWRYDGNLTYVSGKIQTSLDNCRKDIRDRAAGVVYERTYYLSPAQTVGYNDRTFLLDLRALQDGRECWAEASYGAQCFALCPQDTNFTSVIGPLMAGHAGGYVRQMEYGMSDDRAAIQGVARTAPLDLGMPNDRKFFRKVWPWTLGTQGSISVQLRDDYGENYEVHTQSLTAYSYRPMATLMVTGDEIAGNTLEMIVTYSNVSYAFDILALEVEAIPRPHR